MILHDDDVRLPSAYTVLQGVGTRKYVVIAVASGVSRCLQLRAK